VGIEDQTAGSACPNCGRRITHSVAGVCPACLILLALRDDEPDESPATDDAPAEWVQVRRTHIGRYELLDEIARGGMGIVYRARQQQPARVVALKMMLPLLGQNPALRERFRIESDAIARLDHPGILPIYEVGEHEGLPYFSMKYAEGGSLANKVASLTGEWRAVAGIALKVAQAVQHAHERGIVHRDIKPGNILFDARGEPLVADFGLAKFRATDQAMTLPTAVLGSPHYMAPEQISTSFGEVGPATDIYSIGAILYELLCGRVPVSGKDALETLRMVPIFLPPSPRLQNPKVPAALARIALRCLEKDPQHRYVSAAVLAADLERYLHGKPLVAVGSVRKPWRYALLAVIAATAVAIALLVRQPSLTRGPATKASGIGIAVMPFLDLSENKDQQYFSDGLAAELIGMLSQIRELRVASPTASFSARNKTGDIPALARNLGVTNLLQGSVVKVGPHVRIAAQLVRAQDGYQLWSQHYERDVKDIFEIQDEIARAVTGALRVQLLPTQRVVNTHRTPNTAAYMQYLLGRQYYFAGGGTVDAFRRSADAYRAATTLDSDYAAAYAGLAEATAYQADAEADKWPTLRQALAAADRAVALGPELADGYSARALIRVLWIWDWAGARADVDKALKLNPEDSSVHRRSGLLLGALGRLPEAIAEFQKACDLDPMVEGSWGFLGFHLTASGQYAAGRAALLTGQRLAPGNMIQSRYYLGINELMAGHADAALAAFMQSRDEALRIAGQALAEYSLGHRQRSREALDLLIRRHGAIEAYLVATDYAWQGNKDAAFEWLERAFQQRHTYLSRVKIDPLMRSLHDDERFDDLLKRMGVPK